MRQMQWSRRTYANSLFLEFKIEVGGRSQKIAAALFPSCRQGLILCSLASPSNPFAAAGSSLVKLPPADIQCRSESGGRSVKRYLVLLLTGLVLVGFATVAQAQATRTWVSGVGDDVNPCSRTAPCKTFAGAISKTASPGIINCLDPGGFGAVTITKAITINCTGTMGSVLSSGVQGVIINVGTPATQNVVLRNIDINGA